MFEVDLSLVRSETLINNTHKERIFEELLKENNVKFSKYYSLSNDRLVRSEHGKYLDKKYKITVFELDCSENIYDFLLFMLNKKIKQIDKLNLSLS